MFLRYISLHIDFDSGYDDLFKDKFNLDSRFISNYLSQHIRKLKIQTDGDYNMISVVPSKVIKDECRIVGEKALQTRILFNTLKDLDINNINRFDIYLKLLEEGYKTVLKYKNIPLDYLFDLHNKFRASGFKNEWIYKTKKFKELNIVITLKCEFGSDDFKLWILINELSKNSELISGIVIRTLPHEICFQDLFKDVIVDNESIFITDYVNRPKFKLRLEDIMKKVFSFEIIDNGLNYIPLKD